MPTRRQRSAPREAARPTLSQTTVVIRVGGRRIRNRPLAVLVVDDSAVVREVMRTLLPDLGAFIVDAAADALIALRKIEKRPPDVVLLDMELPRMSGLEFMRKLSGTQIPIVVFSSAAGRGTEAGIEALLMGAAAIIEKPKLGLRSFLEESATALGDAIRAAAGLAPTAPRRGSAQRVRHTADVILPPLRKGTVRGRHGPLIAIGASTGGPPAIASVLGSLPASSAGIVIAQHMPAYFTAAFARRLGSTCPFEVKEATTGDRIMPGRVLVAPGDRHLIVSADEHGYVARTDVGPPVSGHRPSVDVLFRSVATTAGHRAVGVLLTGMGRDGATGLGEIRHAGGFTVAQDEATCVVYGMPRAAIEAGVVDCVASLPHVAAAVAKQSGGFRGSRERGGPRSG